MSSELACAEVAQTCLCFNLRKATRLLTQLYDAALRPSGLRVTQFSVLVAVNLGGAVSMNALADVLGVDRTTLTRNLKMLQGNGLVATATGSDRRSRLVSLTDEGSRSLDDALQLWREAQRRAVEALGPARVTELMPVLGQISDTSRNALAVQEA